MPRCRRLRKVAPSLRAAQHVTQQCIVSALILGHCVAGNHREPSCQPCDRHQSRRTQPPSSQPKSTCSYIDRLVSTRSAGSWLSRDCQLFHLVLADDSTIWLFGCDALACRLSTKNEISIGTFFRPTRRASFDLCPSTDIPLLIPNAYAIPHKLCLLSLASSFRTDPLERLKAAGCLNLQTDRPTDNQNDSHRFTTSILPFQSPCILSQSRFDSPHLLYRAQSRAILRQLIQSQP